MSDLANRMSGLLVTPDGSKRAKPEFDDLRRVAEETSRPLAEIRSEVLSALGDSNGKDATPRGK